MATEKKPTTWDEAFCKAQSEFLEIPKDCEVDTGKFKYTYASLPAILRLVLPILHKNGLYLLQSFQSDGVLNTVIGHVSGDYRSSLMPMPTSLQMKAQDYGKQITYMRRYALTAMLGIAPDDDVDAQEVPAPAPLPAPAPKVETVTDPIQAVCERLATESNELVKKWALEPFKNRGAALRGIRSLVNAVMAESGDDVDIYKAAKQRMNQSIDERQP